MQNVKKYAIELINNMPEDCSFEDIQYELYVKTKIEAGLNDLKNNDVLSEDQMDSEFKSWQV